MSRRFKDRFEAGRLLAARLLEYADQPDVVVLGLPRGGVPVAYEVATALGAPLDVFVVRKLGVPGHEELAMGAVATGGVRVLNHDVIESLGIDRSTIEECTELEQKELERRERAYRGERPVPDLEGRVVLVVDDGLATGSTMRAAVAGLRRFRPEKVVVAVPVAAQDTCEEFRLLADDCVCVACPEPFQAVGLWYEDFAQTSDDEVRALLARAWETRANS